MTWSIECAETTGLLAIRRSFCKLLSKSARPASRPMGALSCTRQTSQGSLKSMSANSRREQKCGISMNGGFAPRWGRGGREVVYLEGRRLMVVVPVSTSPEFAPGKATVLFERPSSLGHYAVTADGKQFLLWERLPNQTPLSIHVAHNWFEEFRNRQSE